MNKRLDFHAERFGLTIVDPAEFGVEMHPHGRGQRICFTNGETITDKTLKARIRALVLPPAWRDVRICFEENGHIQATGRDEKGRLQYRYHDDWVNVRNAVKTERLLRFGRALPKLRKRIARDLKRQGTDRRGTAAVAARLIDVAAMRPGHEKYAKDGGRGVASLRRDNLKIARKRAVLKFVGKSQKSHVIEIQEPALVRSLDRMRRERGAKRLFRFREKGESPKDLTANLLNGYLRESSGSKVSAKDFRTFHGSAEALRFLLNDVPPEKADTPPKRKRAVAKAMKSVSELLRNTPTVARASYVHPEIVAAFEEERLPADLMKGRVREGLTRVETGLMRFLEETATQ